MKMDGTSGFLGPKLVETACYPTCHYLDQQSQFWLRVDFSPGSKYEKNINFILEARAIAHFVGIFALINLSCIKTLSK